MTLACANPALAHEPIDPEVMDSFLRTVIEEGCLIGESNFSRIEAKTGQDPHLLREIVGELLINGMIARRTDGEKGLELLMDECTQGVPPVGDVDVD